MTTRQMKTKACSTCGEPFRAVKSPHAKWPSACSPICRLAALDRMIEALQRNRDRLAASLDGADQ